jgi:hypothetical protein
MSSRFWLLSLSLTLFFSSVLADDFKDFRIPDHKVIASGVGVRGMYNWGKSDLYQAQNKSSDAWGSLFGGLYWLKDSDVLRSEIHLSASLSRSRYEEFAENYADSETGEDVRSSPQESASMSWESWYYPSSMPFGAYAGADGYLQTQRNSSTHTGTWSSEGIDYVHTLDSKYEQMFRSADLLGGIVYGRVRDASTVYQVRIVEQRLIKDGALKGELTSQTRQRIAGLFYNRAKYRYRFERYDRYFWRDIEAALKTDPAFNAQAFDAYALYHMDEEAYGWPRITRQCGWRIGPIVDASHAYQKQSDETREFVRYSSPDSSGVDTLNFDDNEYKFPRDNVKIGLQAAYYLPLNLRWQFEFISSFLRYVEPENNGFSLSTQANAYYEIADRWTVTGTFSHSRTLSDPSPDEPSWYLDPYNSWSYSVDADVKYYIENRTALNLSLAYSKSGYTEPQENMFDRHVSNVMAFVGITYNITGHMYSPNSSSFLY